MSNEAIRMRLGRERDEMESRQAAAFVQRVQQQGRVAERHAVETDIRTSPTRISRNIDEVVFGRGSPVDGFSRGPAFGAADPDECSSIVPGSRRAQCIDRQNRNFRSEAAEINFGAPPPDHGETGSLLHPPRPSALHLKSLDQPPMTGRGADEYSPMRRSPIGGAGFHDSRPGGRLAADGGRCVSHEHCESTNLPHAAPMGNAGRRAHRGDALELQSRGRCSHVFDDPNEDIGYGRGAPADGQEARGRGMAAPPDGEQRQPPGSPDVNGRRQLAAARAGATAEFTNYGIVNNSATNFEFRG